MKLKLTSDDRTAIDLLLGETAAAAKAPSHRFVATAARKHVDSVRTVLELLAVLPAPEPSANLAARTLEHITKAGTLGAVAPIAQAARDHRSHPTI
jgi:hypothetical protein